MFRKFPRLLFTFAVLLTAVGAIFAQGDATTRNGTPAAKEDLPKNIQESLAKQRIERDKKDYAELLARGEEAVKISEDLEKSFTQNNQLSIEDRKKLDRLEKIVKKIRSELGGDDDEQQVVFEDDQPATVVNALKTLQNNAGKLFGELKKTTRYSVSVVAVESSNLLLKVVRFLRFGGNEKK